MKQQRTEILAVNSELRHELLELRTAHTNLLQASAVKNYKLKESEGLVQTLLSQILENQRIGPVETPKSELFCIDEKFTGRDKTQYPSLRRQIKIALAQNKDRYHSLQSQIALIYQNLGPGPKSFLD